MLLICQGVYHSLRNCSTIMKIAILCTAFLALLQLGLALAISVLRGKHKVMFGAPEDPKHSLYRVRTAFSNCAEWHPLLIALMLVLQMGGGPGWSIWISPVVVLARYLLVVGLTTFPLHKPNVLRFLGALLTYALTLLLCALILHSYWPNPMAPTYLPPSPH